MFAVQSICGLRLDVPRAARATWMRESPWRMRELMCIIACCAAMSMLSLMAQHCQNLMCCLCNGLGLIFAVRASSILMHRHLNTCAVLPCKRVPKPLLLLLHDGHTSSALLFFCAGVCFFIGVLKLLSLLFCQLALMPEF